MDEAVRALVRLSASLAVGPRERIAAALDRAAEAADGRAVEEVLLQSYLFLGYPAALNALALWREASGRPAPPPSPDDVALWRERGEQTCQRVYGGQYGRLRDHVARLHADMERWMLVEGYGKVLGRPGLELRTRELCVVALLAGLDARPQLRAHLRGALNVGASPAEIEAALEAALEAACAMAPAERAAAARAAWDEVRHHRAARAGD